MVIFAWWICLDGISKRRKISIILILSLLDDPYHIASSIFTSLPDLTANEMLLEAIDHTDSSGNGINSSSSMVAATSSLRAKPKPFSPGQLNDLVCDLKLFMDSSEILASRLGEHDILDSETKITFYRDKDDLLILLFIMKDDFVYCNNIHGVFLGMDFPEYNPDEWGLFMNSSKRSLKCVLLHNGNKFACVPIGHSMIVKEHYLNVKMVLQKLLYSEHKRAICIDFKMVNFLLGVRSYSQGFYQTSLFSMLLRHSSY